MSSFSTKPFAEVAPSYPTGRDPSLLTEEVFVLYVVDDDHSEHELALEVEGEGHPPLARPRLRHVLQNILAGTSKFHRTLRLG